jgi:hypothetical protein
MALATLIAMSTGRLSPLESPLLSEVVVRPSPTGDALGWRDGMVATLGTTVLLTEVI